MFWTKKQPSKNDKDGQNKTYPYRMCWVLISEKYKQVLFVPMGMFEGWYIREITGTIVKEWPLNIGEFQECIQQTLDMFDFNVAEIGDKNDKSPSFEHSKAKSKKSYEVDYVHIQLETDLDNGYGEKEVERINVTGTPFDWNEDSYKIQGKKHLIDTKVAQQVFDVYNACEKIRC